MSLPFADISIPPERTNPGAILARFVDALGFRYRWATEGLREADLDFTPGQGCMTLRKLLEHVHGLAVFADVGLGGTKPADGAAPAGLEGLREATLRRLHGLRGRMAGLEAGDFAGFRVERKGETLPFWFLLNGPLADALTHVGQISAWRRLNGNPWPGANVFMGKPPA
ncbi:MAG: hypothetical protein M5U26_08555 [Planctomycetota bacterium]|nr:hypothetical protein [Planctomycetota bacterium]